MEITQITSGSETPADLTDAELNPLEEARAIAAENALLESEIAAPGGARELRLRNRQRSYGLGCYYYAHPDEFQEFAALPYFDGMHKKPHLTNIMWSVMNHSMQAKGDTPTLQRVSKWGIVFEDFYSEGIRPEDCITVLKNRGGMDYIYEQISASKNAGRQEHSDVVDHTSGASSVHTNPGTPNPFAANDDAYVPAERSASGDAVARSIAMHAVPHAGDKVQELSASSAQMDHEQDVLVDEAAIANRYAKKGHLNRIDLETEVAMQLSPDDLEAILNSAAGLIRYNVIRRDGRGWIHIAGSIKEIVAHGELQPEGTPRSESDRDADLRAPLSNESATEGAASEPTSHGAPALDSGRPIAQETASLTVAAHEDRATSSPRRIDENSANGFTSPKADRVLISPAAIAPALGAFSVTKVETIRASRSGTPSRKHADTIRTSTPAAELPVRLEELPDLSVPPPALLSKPKSRQRR